MLLTEAFWFKYTSFTCTAYRHMKLDNISTSDLENIGVITDRHLLTGVCTKDKHNNTNNAMYNTL